MAGRILVLAMVAGFVVIGALIALTQAERATSTVSARAAVDAYYANGKEAPLPEACRATDAAELAALADATLLLAGGDPRAARERLEKAKLRSAEGAFLLARARSGSGAAPEEVSRAAEEARAVCKGLDRAVTGTGTATSSRQGGTPK